MPRPSNFNLTVERARELIDYNPETGLMTWKSSRKGCLKGAVAGTEIKGYRLATIDRTRYYLHRVAWLMYYGTWPKEQIDHINCIRDDNRISNLREATPGENQENQRRAKVSNHSTGLLGASWSYEAGFTARIRIKKISHYLGTFRTAEEAHQAYLEAKRRFHAFNTL